jgi:hypothetical protein
MLWIESKGSQKLYDLGQNRLLDVKEDFYGFDYFMSKTSAFKIKLPEKSLILHYDDFKYKKEIVNHSCIDLVNDNGRVLALIEQN